MENEQKKRIHAQREWIRKRVQYNEVGMVQQTLEAKRMPLAWSCLVETAAEKSRLEKESEEMITNVRTANEAQEVLKRRQDIEERKRRIESLEHESCQAQIQFEEISSRWSWISNMNDSLDIHNECVAQRQKCTELLGKKNNMIKVLKEDLENCDKRYQEELLSQNEVVTLLIARIEQNMELLRKESWSHLDLIQSAVHAEFKDFLDEKQKEENKLFRIQNAIEQETVEENIRKQKLYDDKPQETKLIFEDEFRKKKIEHEKHIQHRKLELTQLKPNCLQLKLTFDYNFKFIQKRVEENIYNNTQQKRKKRNMSDLVTMLVNKTKQTSDEFKRDVEKLRADIGKLNDKIRKLKHVAIQLYRVNELKYRQIWNFNQEEAGMYFQRILNTDRTINEAMLGGNYLKTSIDQMLKMKYAIPRKTNNAINKEKCVVKCPQSHLESKSDRQRIHGCVKKAFLHHVNFLSDPNINAVLQSLNENAELTVKLHKVFESLSLTSQTEVNFLVDFMKPYIYCLQCKKILPFVNQLNIKDRIEERFPKDHDVTDISNVHSKKVDIINRFVQSFELAAFDTSITPSDIGCTPTAIGSDSSLTSIFEKEETNISQSKLMIYLTELHNLTLAMDKKLGESFNDQENCQFDINLDHFQTEFSCTTQRPDNEPTKIGNDLLGIKSSTESRESPGRSQDQSDLSRAPEMKHTLLSKDSGKFLCTNVTHELSIDNSDILNIVKQLIKELQTKRAQKESDVKGHIIFSEDSKETHSNRGNVFKKIEKNLKIFPEEKIEQLKLTFKSFEKYYQVLCKRQKLYEKVGGLNHSNEQFRTLLRSYIKPEAEAKSESVPPIHACSESKRTVEQLFFDYA